MGEDGGIKNYGAYCIYAFRRYIKLRLFKIERKLYLKKLNSYDIIRKPRSGCKDVWNAYMCEGAHFSRNDIPLCPTTAQAKSLRGQRLNPFIKSNCEQNEMLLSIERSFAFIWMIINMTECAAFGTILCMF